MSILYLILFYVTQRGVYDKKMVSSTGRGQLQILQQRCCHHKTNIAATTIFACEVD